MTPVEKVFRATMRQFAAPPELNCWQWGEMFRTLPKGVSPKPGPYSTESTPWQREPQESFHDPAVRVTVLMWGKRMGKTECTLNLQGRTIHVDPQSILVVYPTLDSAKNWSKRFFAPMIRASHVLTDLIAPSRSRDADNTVLLKKFPGGHIACIGANSPSGFRQIQAPIIICDEIDAMENSAEGDPITLAFGRADNYPSSVQVLSSTPTIKGSSRIEAWFNDSDQRRWFVPCQKCGTFQVITWASIDFSQRGTVDDPRWVCSNDDCQHAHVDPERIESVLVGRWQATAVFDGTRGYHIPSLATTFRAKKGYKSRLHQIVSDFRKAKRDGSASLRVWVNTELAETYEEEGAKIDHHGLRDRREPYALEPVPAPVCIITAGVDQQKDRLEVEFVGWGADEESWGLEYAIIFGDPEGDEVWTELDHLLTREFSHPSGGRLRVVRTFIDMGDKQSRVLAFCAPRLGRGVFACKGVGRAGNTQPPLLPPRPSLNNQSRIPFWPVGVNEAKIAIYDRLTIGLSAPEADGTPQPSPRGCHFPEGRGYDDVYFEQLVAESVHTKYYFGQAYRIFEKPSAGTRNEALDCRCYALAALHSLGVVAWGRVMDAVLKTATDSGSPRSPTTPAKQAPPRTAAHPAPEKLSLGQLKLQHARTTAQTAAPAKPRFVPRRPGGFAKNW